MVLSPQDSERASPKLQTLPPQMAIPQTLFGYSFDSASGFPTFPTPPEPAPGPSLLDADDSSMLTNFFDNFGTSQLGTDSSGHGILDMEDPAFFNPSNQGFRYVTGDHGGPTTHSHNGTSMDPVAAASMLFNDTQLTSPTNFSAEDGAGVLVKASTSMPHASGHFQGFGHIDQDVHSIQHNSRMPKQQLQQAFFNGGVGMMNQGRRSSHRPLPDLQWGSDERFRETNYDPPPEFPTGEERERRDKEAIEKVAAAIQGKDSGTDPSHDVQSVRKRPATEEAEVRRPQQRRRTITQESNELEESDEGSPKRLTRTPTKRRVKGGKNPRENLTEAQKRENHIHSEQKRRNLIKQGFDDLVELVPGLNAGGYSKSSILAQSYDYLFQLLEDNKRMEEMLRELDEA